MCMPARARPPQVRSPGVPSGPPQPGACGVGCSPHVSPSPPMNVLSALILGLLVLAAAVKLLTLNFWRAILCLAPGSMRLRSEGPVVPDELPAPLAPLVGQLHGLGFVALGIH